MIRTIFFLAILLIGIKTFSQNPAVYAVKPVKAYSKSVTDPYIENKDIENFYITNIETSDALTVITFVYKNISREQNEIYLPSPEDFYIRANGKSFKLLGSQNIGHQETPTKLNPGNTLTFYAQFQPLPPNVTKFDLIENAADSNFGLTGVHMKSLPPDVNVSRFLREYNYGQFHRPGTSKWEQTSKANNTLIFNINDKGDIVRITNGGQIIKYHKVRVENVIEDWGEPYQKITTINDKNQEIILKLYKDRSYGLVIRNPDGSAIHLYKK